MFGTKRILKPAARMCIYLRSKRLAHQNCCTVSGRSLANTVTSCCRWSDRPYLLAHIQTLEGCGTMVGERSGQ